MIKKSFSFTVIILIFTLLLSSLSLAATPAREQILGSSLPSGIQLESQIPDGLTASDWSQIRALMERQGYRIDLSPQAVDTITQQVYLKASNTGALDLFGTSVAMSGDTVVVGAILENSNAKGVNGDQDNDLAEDAGAAYVFVRSGTGWSQQAYLKASNTGAGDRFGKSVAVSGNTIVIGAMVEDSSATGVNGNEDDDLAADAGAAYVFVRNGTNWSQQAYLKASNTDPGDYFGYSVAVSGDTIVVGAIFESSDSTGVDGDQNNNFASHAGAAYVFVKNGTTWTQQAYLKADYPSAHDLFGYSVSTSGDTVVVGVPYEDLIAGESGAAYVFFRSGTSWSQQTFLKASNPDYSDTFGESVAVSGDTIVVGADGECSSAKGVNGNQYDNSAEFSGAAYVFVRNGTSWNQQAYLKASNTDVGDLFGHRVAVSSDTVVVGAIYEASNTTGVDGNQDDDSASKAGAAYVFVRNGTSWSQQAYLKASNTDAEDQFGYTVAASGNKIVVGAYLEDSNAVGLNGNQSDNSASDAGAAYLFFETEKFCFLPTILRDFTP